MLTKPDGLLHDRKVVPHNPKLLRQTRALEKVTSAQLTQLSRVATGCQLSNRSDIACMPN
jgi:hypothetical protein